MSMLALSGWGQPHDALAAIAPGADHFEYASYENPAAALEALTHAAQGKDTIIGWSLGGQLAVRAIATGLIAPKRLVLIAAPFQFVASNEVPLGMKPDLHARFYENYTANPERTLKKAWELIVKDDRNEAEVRGYLSKQDSGAVLMQNWKAWLDVLEDFSCAGLDMSNFPPTLLLHGNKDVVISIEQSYHFKQTIAHARLVEFPDCGHAPHWHATDKVSELIHEHNHV
jgi:pimeloyl-[acyl-carrier protein] methyl ester esterase